MEPFVELKQKKNDFTGEGKPCQMGSSIEIYINYCIVRNMLLKKMFFRKHQDSINLVMRYQFCTT